ncbi:hypothetical protein FA13DRAFT_1703149 [Coprinellus micaceus]|uniref:Uncharacterized protein n=1 Tax=Coprinellus micaceus TaxID=71717 RepID=A0A4Y7RD86_COPMI|nr:hypothetical protein FA13DRAFT_1703149 [Coprinellus micaceus]
MNIRPYLAYERSQSRGKPSIRTLRRFASVCLTSIYALRSSHSLVAFLALRQLGYAYWTSKWFCGKIVPTWDLLRFGHLWHIRGW